MSLETYHHNLDDNWDLEQAQVVKAIITNPSLDEDEKSTLVSKLMQRIRYEYPNLHNHATVQDIRETELKLQKEIEQVRLEIAQTKTELVREIEKLRQETLTIKADLTKDIEQVRADLSKEIEQVRSDLGRDIERVRADLIKWSFLFWLSQFGAIIALAWRALGHS